MTTGEMITHPGVRNTPVTDPDDDGRMCGKCLAVMTLVVAGSVRLSAQDVAPQNPQPGAVGGVVRYASGQPIADVRVTLSVPRDSARTTRTAGDGAFRFEAVEPGQYQLSASLAGVVAKTITVTSGSELTGVAFSIPDGSPRRVVTAHVVMSPQSADRQVPARIGIGVKQDDGTLVIPLAPGDQRLVVRLPSGYFLDSATHGSATVYSLAQVGGRRLTSAAFSITVPPEPQSIPELVITLGVFR